MKNEIPKVYKSKKIVQKVFFGQSFFTLFLNHIEDHRIIIICT